MGVLWCVHISRYLLVAKTNTYPPTHHNAATNYHRKEYSTVDANLCPPVVNLPAEHKEDTEFP